jgi:hypothetical protein
VLAEYAATEAGLIAAFAASAVGDGVEVPNGTIALAATLDVPDGRTLRGRGWASIIDGYITVGDDCIVDNFKNYQSVNVATDVVGINKVRGTGEAYVHDVFVKIVNAGSGKALCLLSEAGTLIWFGRTLLRCNGGTGSRWAYGEGTGAVIEGNHGNVKAWIGV